MLNSGWNRSLRIIFLFLVLCNFPSFALVHISPFAGTVLSYSTFLILITYSFFEKVLPIKEYLLLGFFYFFISLLVDSTAFDSSLFLVIKYFIFFYCVNSILFYVKNIEIFGILILGCFSIFIEVYLSGGLVGRFSGFYLNPNAAGFAVLIGFIFSMSLFKSRLKILAQVLFSVAGFLTFSRTFLVLWIIVNLITFFHSFKNGLKLFFGVILFTLFIAFFQDLGIDSQRFSAYSLALKGELSDDLAVDIRSDTWSIYYEDILNSLFFGNGFLSFSGKKFGSGFNEYSVQGVHNSYLMVLGESGIFVFIIFLFLHIRYLYVGFNVFSQFPVYFLLSISLALFLLTSHNFFDNYLILFLSAWLMIKRQRLRDHSFS
jgi:hypothetical protein